MLRTLPESQSSLSTLLLFNEPLPYAQTFRWLPALRDHVFLPEVTSMDFMHFVHL